MPIELARNRSGGYMRYFIAVCLGLLMVHTVWAQDDVAVVSAELNQHLRQIETWVTDYRQLEMLQPVDRRFPSVATVEQFLMDSITSKVTPEIVDEAMGFYVALDLLPPNTDLLDVYLALLTDQVGGYYDSTEKTMNTLLISGGELGDALPLLEQTIYAHEFVHALQDQHYDLESLGFDSDSDLSFDQLIALQSLIEGDATVVMNEYLLAVLEDRPLAALGLLGSSVMSGSMNLPPDTPPILINELLFPYEGGAAFVTELVEVGGWEQVHQAFSALPQSTEHILHPATYLSGEAPQPVTLTEMAVLANDAQWQQVTDQTIGEFYLRQYLTTQLENSVAYPAAQGWGGDRLQVYRQVDGDQVAWVLKIVWDTPTDADEFAQAYTQLADARFGFVTNAKSCWQGATDSICTLTRNSATVIVGAPTLELAQTLLSDNIRF